MKIGSAIFFFSAFFSFQVYAGASSTPRCGSATRVFFDNKYYCCTKMFSCDSGYTVGVDYCGTGSKSSSCFRDSCVDGNGVDQNNDHTVGGVHMFAPGLDPIATSCTEFVPKAQ